MKCRIMWYFIRIFTVFQSKLVSKRLIVLVADSRRARPLIFGLSLSTTLTLFMRVTKVKTRSPICLSVSPLLTYVIRLLVANLQNCASSQDNLSSGCPTKRVSKQPPQLQRPARKLKFHLQQVYMQYFGKKRITKALNRLRRCAGWSAPVLVANPRRQVFSRRGPNFCPYLHLLSCVCYVFVRVCLYVLCGHLLGRADLLALVCGV